MKGNTAKTPRYSLRKLLDPCLDERAQCKNHTTLPWVGKRCPGTERDLAPDPQECAAMSAVCDLCPIQINCAEFALTSGVNGRGVDGGFYAGVWIPWPADYGHRKRTDRSMDARRQLRNLLKEAK